MTDTTNKRNEEEIQEQKHKVHDLKGFLKKDLKFDVAPATLGDGELADIIVWLRDLKSTIEGREKLLNSVLQSRHQDKLGALKAAYDKNGAKEYFRVPGDSTGGVTYEYVVQQRLDTAAIQEEMGADWIEEHKSPTTFFQAKAVKG